jgi:hypothetical protein
MPQQPENIAAVLALKEVWLNCTHFRLAAASVKISYSRFILIHGILASNHQKYLGRRSLEDSTVTLA